MSRCLYYRQSKFLKCWWVVFSHRPMLYFQTRIRNNDADWRIELPLDLTLLASVAFQDVPQTSLNQTYLSQTLLQYLNFKQNYTSAHMNGSMIQNDKSYQIHGTFCSPNKGQVDSSKLLVAVHGIGFDSSYWDYSLAWVSWLIFWVSVWFEADTFELFSFPLSTALNTLSLVTLPRMVTQPSSTIDWEPESLKLQKTDSTRSNWTLKLRFSRTLLTKSRLQTLLVESNGLTSLESDIVSFNLLLTRD